jgi:hypothetical protein
MTPNNGVLINIERGRRNREERRAIIRSLPNYLTGFTRKDVEIEKSAAKRELREMVSAGILVTTKLPNNTLIYRAGPESLLKRSWRIDESVYAELEESLCDL